MYIVPINNSQAFGDDEDKNLCLECGTPRDDQSTASVSVDDSEALDITDLTTEQIAAGLQNMSGGIATAQDVENAARAEEGLPPLEPLADQLVKFNIFTESIELQQLSTDDLNALLAYVDEPTPMPPHLVTRCCVAAEPGSIMQVCQNCEKVLHTGTNSGTPYPVNALVGFDCDNGKMREALVETIKESAEAPTEATRTIKPRGSKKRAKKEPEQERARQADAGRKAAASTPKKGKAKAATRAKGRK